MNGFNTTLVKFSNYIVLPRVHVGTLTCPATVHLNFLLSKRSVRVRLRPCFSSTFYNQIVFAKVYEFGFSGRIVDSPSFPAPNLNEIGRQY